MEFMGVDLSDELQATLAALVAERKQKREAVTTTPPPADGAPAETVTETL
jgi:hypothetical protein